jgi:hypothetical protein
MKIGATGLRGGGFKSFALLFSPFPAPLCTLSYTCEILKTNQGVRMCFYDGFCNDVIRLQLQPSLSTADRDESSRCGPSAFALQAFL